MESPQAERESRVGKICRAVSSIEEEIRGLRAFVRDLVGDADKALPRNYSPSDMEMGRPPRIRLEAKIEVLAPPLGVMLDNLPTELHKHAKNVGEIKAMLAERLL